MVAKLIDGYLSEVAPDVHLKLLKFRSLAGVVPDDARLLDDGLYRAIDIYLKAHLWRESRSMPTTFSCQSFLTTSSPQNLSLFAPNLAISITLERCSMKFSIKISSLSTPCSLPILHTTITLNPLGSSCL
ncbi:BTB/POZ domain-containing protein At1g30440-like [Magnolia sinica]|uniref:BTB/POZ domain-containing protein At1g30440-like n=1 Tax=Magnolia sinica TaxID=86752 RepID=UPI00265A1F26|nr:BTB/POZ domain-containing protein At1g30440-like [Magnolia sinica]